MTTSPVRILGFAGSTYVRTARMVCIEKGVAHELAPLEFRAASHRALHPFARMPVMQHGDVTLYESLAIASYVDEALEGPPLQPPRGLARARMLEALSAASDYAYRDVVGGLLHGEAAPSESAIEAARAALAPFDARLEGGEHLAGALSLADLVLFPMVDFAAARAPSALDGHRRLAAWRERIAKRPSATKTKAKA